MTEAQRDLLHKARASLEAARLLQNAGFLAFAAAIALQPSENTRVDAPLKPLKTQSSEPYMLF